MLVSTRAYRCVFANVVQVLKNNEIEDAIRLLARKLQLSGFHGLDFVLEQDTDAAYLIELNPRATQLGHLNLSAHGDLAGVMARKLKNEAPDNIASENQIQNTAIAFFPNAFMSNPGSAYLHQGYHDVPWDEPALVRELVYDPGRRLWLRWCLRTFSAGNHSARQYKPRLGTIAGTRAMREGFRLPSSHSLTVTAETPKPRAIDASDSPADSLDSSHVTN